ncbi:hypothetical protein N7492_009745 [Penicillium capsulatum]|uniref:BTB domain-containing protein n=1 Tax=Penicillium capsulatum TaxID=69766 RepID=A0A9W9LFT2_9EURO|nr:hypothetical protein N7492_009745 [Penicillium capsulatum]KAJ6114173.1 hypothetical protein N7512_007618 [Penicillium capsulatum]
MSSHSGFLLELLDGIRDNGLHSDLEVKCQSFSFKLHRCIVCPQSEFFHKAITGSFIEAESHAITLHDDPLIVSKMFDYLYRADYNDVPAILRERGQDQSENFQEDEPNHQISSLQSPPAQWSHARINVQIYIAADKYAIDRLKTLAEHKLRCNMESGWDDLGMISLIELVYGPQCPPHSGIEAILLEFVMKHLKSLHNCLQFHAVLKDFPDLQDKLLHLTMRRVVDLEE